MRMSFVAVLVFFLLGMVFAAPVAESEQGFTKFDKRDNTGDGTYYFQGGAFGSCGQQHSDSDPIVALSTAYCQSWNSPTCGRRIGITAINGPTPGAYIEATVADTCMGCQPQDVDCSVSVFSALTGGDLGVGRFKVSWKFLS